MNFNKVAFAEGGNDVVIAYSGISVDGATTFTALDMDFQEHGVAFTREVGATTVRMFIPWRQVWYIRQEV